MNIASVSLSKKILLTLLGGIFGALLISSMAFILIDMHLSRRGIEEEQRIRANIIGQNVATALIFEDEEAAKQDMEALKIDPYLLHARLLRKDRTLFVGFPENIPVMSEHLMKTREPIYHGDELIGYIEIDSSLGAFYARLTLYLKIVVAIFVLTLLSIFPLAIILQRFISMPILRLAETVQKISQTRDFHHKVKPIKGKELGVLTQGINEMLIQIDLHEQGLFAEINERKIAEKKLMASEKHLTTTLTAMTEAVVATDLNNCVQWYNPVAETLLGFPGKEVIGRPLKTYLSFHEIIFPQDAGPFESGSEPLVKTVSLHNGKGTVDLQYSLSPIRDDHKCITGYVFVFRDITEQKKLESDLRQAQKMDAVGQLAGGVAHDFNNLLTGVIGSAEILKMRRDLDKESIENLDVIIKMADRAAALTRKLLAFSREEKPTDESVVDVRDAIKDSVEILQHTIDPKIDLKMDLPDQPLLVRGSASQMQNVFLNLGLNARDAMLDGGVLKYRVKMDYLDEQYCRQHPDMEEGAGYYVEVTVSDTGHGMSKQVQERIFEPFFTTKEIGRGTGLGLSTAYAIIKESKGNVSIYSEEGLGTSFKILLPLQNKKVTEAEASRPGLEKGNERILIVDDEDVVRETASKSLQSLGYITLCAGNGEEALDMIESEKEPFDLVVLDMVMPVKNGEETIEEIKDRYPKLPVIIATGFSPEGTAQRLLMKGASAILEKPFKIAELSAAIRQALSTSG